MKHKYTPGQDCGCHAYSESECGCGADWTPAEIYELREQLAAERAIADRLAKSIMNWKSEQWRGTPEKATEQVMSALAAWKEARSE